MIAIGIFILLVAIAFVYGFGSLRSSNPHPGPEYQFFYWYNVDGVQTYSTIQLAVPCCKSPKDYAMQIIKYHQFSQYEDIRYFDVVCDREVYPAFGILRCNRLS